MPTIISRYKLWLLVLAFGLAIASCVFAPLSLAQFRRALWSLPTNAPILHADGCTYDAMAQRLTLRGENFHPAAQVTLIAPSGFLAYRTAQVLSDSLIQVDGIEAPSTSVAVTITITNPTASYFASSVTGNFIELPMAAPPRRGRTTPTLSVSRSNAPDQATSLSIAEAQQIIAQAVAEAEANNFKATISVVDAEGFPLGTFVMNGALPKTRVGNRTACTPTGCAEESLPLRCGLEGVCVRSCAAALAKAVTGSFLSSRGHAFSTRTASFIVQEHFPPGVNFQGSGPLFGVQFSQLLCSDVNPRSALGLSADPGGLPLYKNGVKVGGVGVEGDGRYTLSESIDNPVEETIARAATRGFEAPDAITGDKIIVNGIRFPYARAAMPPVRTVQAFAALAGALTDCKGLSPAALRGKQPSEFITATIGDAPAGRINTRKFQFGAASFTGSADLSQTEVVRILTQAAKQAFITRAAIRQPLNSAAEVNITVCDANGDLLGIFSTADAPIFGFDVSAQKARSAAFFSHPDAATRLRNANFGASVTASEQDGVRLTGNQAFSNRAIGFLARPFYPDGIDRTAPGPYAVASNNFSPFNVGLQLDLILQPFFVNLVDFVENNSMAAGVDATTTPCPSASLSSLANGLQIFPGSVPLYKNGKLVGAIGISGDGVDQDDLIAAMGSTGFEAPENLRTDQVIVRGTRLPFVKFPRNPNRE